MKNIFVFFDKLEDKIRHNLSHTPIIYALFGTLGIVLTWRGIWHIADDLAISGWLSALIGIIILLATGLLVAIAIGDEVLISAFRGRRKANEIGMEDALTLSERVDEIKKILDNIEKRMEIIKKEENKIVDIEREIIDAKS